MTRFLVGVVINCPPVTKGFQLLLVAAETLSVQVDEIIIHLTAQYCIINLFTMFNIVACSLFAFNLTYAAVCT